jgi:hypothetical protein
MHGVELPLKYPAGSFRSLDPGYTSGIKPIRHKDLESRKRGLFSSQEYTEIDRR